MWISEGQQIPYYKCKPQYKSEKSNYKLCYSVRSNWSNYP